MKILVTGAKGQLGRDITSELDRLQVEYKGIDIDDFDLTDEESVRKCFLEYKPDRVIHCAAYVAVDKAEEQKELCYNVNVKGTEYVAKACNDVGAALMYISTDYVFTGIGDKPFETNGEKGPLNQYGFTKYQGELKVQEILNNYFIVRISWVFGVGGNNFIKTMLQLSETRDSLMVVDDQIGSPTFTYDAAKVLCEMIMSEKFGIYHVTNEGFCSWFEFAKEIFAQAGKKIEVNPVKTTEYKSAAIRPLNSRLSKISLDNAGFHRLPDWKDALKRYLKLTSA